MKTLFHHLDSPVQALLRKVARDIILPAFYEHIADELICVKNDHSIVTKIDFEVQEYLQHELLALLPDSGFLGEEETDYTVDKRNPEWVWVLDPIDGTHNFAYQNSDFGTMLSLWHVQEQKPVFGWIYMPVADVMIAGGEPIGVTSNRDLASAYKKKPLSEMQGMLNYSSFASAGISMQANGQAFNAIHPSSCAAVKFVSLLQGTADFAVFGLPKIWDLCAGFALLEATEGYVAQVNAPWPPQEMRGEAGYGLSLERPKSYAAWYLAVRHKEDWPLVRDQLFKGIL